jgi:hypothetical protein
MSKLIRRIRYIVMIILFLLSARYALTLRQRLGFALKHIGQVHELPADPPEGGYSAAPKPTRREPEWQPTQIGAVMGDAFRTGKLPAPMSVGTDDPDRTAAELARQIALMDEHSTAALVTAVAAAGFNIRGANGDVLGGKRNAGQGIAFQDSEVTAMAKMYGDGAHLQLADLSAAITESIPGLKKIPMTDLLLDGIRKNAVSKKAELRMWARLIVELGHHASPPYDLLSPKLDPASVQLDSIQFGLLLRRLSADFAISGSKGKDPKVSSVLPCPQSIIPAALPLSRDVAFPMNAVWHESRRPFYLEAALPQEGGGSKLPCTLPEEVMQDLDSIAYASGMGFDQLMEELETSGLGGKTAQVFAKAAAIANILGAYFKLVFTALVTDAKITMDGSPLVRTVNAIPGCDRKLHAQIMQHVGNWQVLNCMRLLLNNAGVDVSVPQDGTLKKVKTQWHIVEGGTKISHQDSSITYAIVQWVSYGPHVQTYVGSPADAPGDYTQATTDENGIVEVTIQGAPQREALAGWAVPVTKQAKVQLSFAAKPVNMKQDFIDTGAAGGLLTNPVTLLSTIPVEMMLRSRWFASPVFTVPIKDWIHCVGGWAGSITYDWIRQVSQTRAGSVGPGGSSETHIFDLKSTDHREWHLSGTQEGEQYVGATWSAEVSGYETSISKQTGTDACGGWHGTTTGTMTTSGQDQGSSQFQITINDGRYVIQKMLGETAGNPDAVRSESNLHAEVENIYDGNRATCVSSSGDDPTYRSSHPIDADVLGVIYGTLDPNDSKHLSGSEVRDLGDGTKVTIKWDLTPCGQVQNTCGRP